jgi:hypothetical protein
MITGLALINEVEDRLGWRQTETLEGTQRPETRKLVRLLNRVLNSMQALDDWPLLRTDGTLQLIADDSGDAYFELTNGSATVELGASETTLAFSEQLIGRAIQLGSHATIYRIKSVESTTQLTLNRPYLGDDWTDADGELSYVIAQDQYFLPEDFDRPTEDWQNFFGDPGIDPIGPNAFRKERIARGNSLLLDDPNVFTVYGLDDSETFQKIHFDPWPDNERILNYTYQKNHPKIETDEDRILFPKTHEGIIIEAMLQLAHRDYEDSDKSQVVLQDLIRTINQAQAPGNVAQDRMRFTPNGKHRLAQYRSWRGGSRIDWGTAFDQLDNINFR